jgi:hypothetical protein
LVLRGCATPIEIKKASTAQIELINSVDTGVSDHQKAFAQFHREKENRIIEEGRMQIACIAIDEAIYSPNSKVTADQLFQNYKAKIEPWITDEIINRRGGLILCSVVFCLI